MGYKNHQTLREQVYQCLVKKCRFGQARHDGKRKGEADQYIYSHETFATYLKQASSFVTWCKEHHGCKTLRQCRCYSEEWLQGPKKNGRTCSPSTIQTRRAALAKVYGEKGVEICSTVPRAGKDTITRSRYKAKRDQDFSEERNADLVSFMLSTGLRRKELSAVRGTDLHRDESTGTYYISIGHVAKGGRSRNVPVIGDVERVKRICEIAGNKKVKTKKLGSCDIHHYRQQYAATLYRMFARTYEECEQDPFWNKEHYNGKGQKKGGWDKNSLYITRGDNPHWYDKKALLIVSHALGHNRISVTARNYLFDVVDPL